MRTYSIAPRHMFRGFWLHRELLFSLARRDIVGRYSGSFLGLLWSFVHPFFMLFVYTFVFGIVLKANWTSGGEPRSEFALVLFAGLMVFNFFAECVIQAPELVLVNPSYVKKVIFPLEVLPLVSLVSALFHFGVSLVVWLAAHLLLVGLPPVTMLLFPLVVVPLAFLILGISWIFASLGVFVRDLGQFIKLFTSALLFLSPVFYPSTALPERYRPLFNLNPLTYLIESARNLLCWGKELDPLEYGIACIFTLVFAWLGFAWFQLTRKGFADVI